MKPIRVTQTGLRLTALAAARTPTTIGFNADGLSGIRTIRVIAEPLTAMASFAYVRVGGDTLTVSNTDLVVTSNIHQDINVRGMTKINVLSPGLTTFVNVTPLED